MRARLLLATALAIALCAPAARGDEDVLASRLDAETAAAVRRIVDEAGAAGLPAGVLVAKALEGASKHAPGPRIVTAVRAHAAALAGARDALGPAAAPGEIAAGAGALLSGIPPDSLARLRDARAEGSRVVSLVVLSDLAARGVPPREAAAAVLAVLRAGARDEDLMSVRTRVEHDIAAGASPGTAVMLRSRALITGRSGTPPRESSRPRVVPSSPLREGP
jgi:hypothetical protein